MTSRRGFLGVLAAAMAADPEQLLWRPGAKLISIPKPRRLRIRDLQAGDVVTFGSIPQRFVIASASHSPECGSVTLYPTCPPNWMEQIRIVPQLRGMPMPPASAGITASYSPVP